MTEEIVHEAPRSDQDGTELSCRATGTATRG